MGERGNAKEAASVSIQINSKDVVKWQKQACIINSGGGAEEKCFILKWKQELQIISMITVSTWQAKTLGSIPSTP